MIFRTRFFNVLTHVYIPAFILVSILEYGNIHVIVKISLGFFLYLLDWSLLGWWCFFAEVVFTIRC